MLVWICMRASSLPLLRVSCVAGGGEEGHVCRFCGRVCSSRYNLKKHERDLHLNRGAKFTCELCKRQYGSLNSLQVHCSNSHPTGVVRRRHSLNSTTYHLGNQLQQQSKSRPSTDDEASQSPQKHQQNLATTLSSLIIPTKQENNSSGGLLSPVLSLSSQNNSTSSSSSSITQKQPQQQNTSQHRMLSPHHQMRTPQPSQSRLQSPQHYSQIQSPQHNVKLLSPVMQHQQPQQQNRIQSPQHHQPVHSPQQQKTPDNLIIDPSLSAKLQDHIQKASLQYPTMQSPYNIQPQQTPPIQQTYINQTNQIQPRRYLSPVNSIDSQLPMFPFHPQHFLEMGARALAKSDNCTPIHGNNIANTLSVESLQAHTMNQNDSLNSDDREVLDEAAVLTKNLMFS